MGQLAPSPNPYTGDTLSPEKRSERMSRVRNKDTKPELFVRRLVHALGYRYRLHSDSLPGHPDLVFSARNRVIFVHGCFWHRHQGCALNRTPKSRPDFWVSKFERNVMRDEANLQRLLDLGWRFLIVWECQARDNDTLRMRITEFLGPAKRDPGK